MTILKIGSIELLIDERDKLIYGIKDPQKCSVTVRDFIRENLMGKSIQVLGFQDGEFEEIEDDVLREE